MTDSIPQIHLASSSPRRAELLDALGITYTMAGMDIDEKQLPGEAPDAMVLRLAAGKAAAAREAHPGVVLAADTAVVVDDAVFGKPRDENDAISMLTRLSGRTHRVMTGVAVISADDHREALSISDVRFREIKPDEALAYWQSGEPRGKAGAYAVQGLGGLFVEEIRGSYTGIVGLPVFETATLLAAAGIEVIKRAALE